MARGSGGNHTTARAATPRTVVKQEFVCEECGSKSRFDGNGGKWCPVCETSDYLVRRERLYRLVEIALD